MSNEAAAVEIVTGIFTSSAGAERAGRKLEAILEAEKMIVLTPGKREIAPKAATATATERPTAGEAIGGLAGAAVGMASGLEVAAAVTGFIPGVGPVVALGVLGGALLGTLGGAKAGQSFERGLKEGLHEDDFFVYEDALRNGRSVLITYCDDHSTAASVREFLEREGAEAAEAAHKIWWSGLRTTEQQHYSGSGSEFDRDEKFYQMGFEAALHARLRGQDFDQILAEKQSHIEALQQQNPGVEVAEPFRRGFERGRAYDQDLQKQYAVEPRA